LLWVVLSGPFLDFMEKGHLYLGLSSSTASSFLKEVKPNIADIKPCAYLRGLMKWDAPRTYKWKYLLATSEYLGASQSKSRWIPGQESFSELLGKFFRDSAAINAQSLRPR
jgi:hypothetical protein